MEQKRPIIVGISGASGAVYGIRLLETLKALSVETHLVISKSAELTLAYETDLKIAQVQALADVCYKPGDIGAAISSGSFATLGMVVAPCSVRSMAEIACGTTAGLLTRAADVTLKERRRLVLMVRETPLHVGHLQLMVRAAQAGATILPPMPAFYAGLRSLEDLVQQTAARALDQLGLEPGLLRRWEGPQPTE